MAQHFFYSFTGFNPSPYLAGAQTAKAGGAEARTSWSDKALPQRFWEGWSTPWLFDALELENHHLNR